VVTSDAGPIAGFSVQYTNEATATNSSVIKCVLGIVNNSGQSVPLTELTLRYYYTNEVTHAITIDTNFAHASGGVTYADLTTKISKQNVVLTPSKTNANAYVEIGFMAGSPSILSGDVATQVDWQIHQTNYDQNYDQSNDYSFDASKTSAQTWDHVALYRNGTTLLWGVPPP
jgi:cellulose 1,4-beta-cellobiosidase